jgi:hypothetical protein
MAEIACSVLARQCVDRRIDSRTETERESACFLIEEALCS